MFEVPQEPKSKGLKEVWAILAVVFVVVVVGGAFYLTRQPGGEADSPASATAGAPDLAQADPSRDLKLSRATLGKDVTGTRAVWSIRIQNDSPYAYTDIQYEARYFDAGDRLLTSSEGTIEGSIEPREEKSFSDLQDILYPEGTARYEFRLKDAAAAVR